MPVRQGYTPPKPNHIKKAKNTIADLESKIADVEADSGGILLVDVVATITVLKPLLVASAKALVLIIKYLIPESNES